MIYWAICTEFDHFNGKRKTKNGNDQKSDRNS